MPDAVKALLDRGADVNARDATHGRTPLVFAASQNRVEAMKVLIAQGRRRAGSRRPSSTTASGRPPTTRRARRATASSRPRPDARPTRTSISTIRRRPVRPRRRARAGRAGRRRARRQARRRAAADAGGGRDAAAVPAVRGRPSDIEQIGRQGGFTALHYAARDGYADAAMLLLDAGMDINAPTEGDRSTPMVVAIINGQYDLAMALPRARRQSEPGERRRRGAAVRGAQQRVGAAHLVSAADGRRAAEGVVPRS